MRYALRYPISSAKLSRASPVSGRDWAYSARSRPTASGGDFPLAERLGLAVCDFEWQSLGARVSLDLLQPALRGVIDPEARLHTSPSHSFAVLVAGDAERLKTVSSLPCLTLSWTWSEGKSDGCAAISCAQLLNRLFVLHETHRAQWKSLIVKR
jgi:hypothetical protein